MPVRLGTLGTCICVPYVRLGHICFWAPCTRLGLHVLARLCDFPLGSACFCMGAEPLSNLENNPAVCDFLVVTESPRPPVTGTRAHTYPAPLESRGSENSQESAMVQETSQK